MCDVTGEERQRVRYLKFILPQRQPQATLIAFSRKHAATKQALKTEKKPFFNFFALNSKIIFSIWLIFTNKILY